SADGTRVAYLLPGKSRLGPLYREAPGFDVEREAVIPGATGAFHPLAFSPDGRKLAVKSDARVYIWNWDTMKVDAEMSVPRLDRCAFSPDMKYLATASNTQKSPGDANFETLVYLFEIETSKELGNWKL